MPASRLGAMHGHMACRDMVVCMCVWYQVWSQAQSSRSKTIQDMVNVLYDKTSDAQEGVLSMLMEDMADQQVRYSGTAGGGGVAWLCCHVSPPPASASLWPACPLNAFTPG
jgi:hypothetical protein